MVYSVATPVYNVQMAAIPEAVAVQYHQAGKLQQAEDMYRQILQVDPCNADVLHLLGVITHQAGKNDLAIGFIAQAIDICPCNAVFHNSLGEVYRARGQSVDAAVQYQQAIRLKPDYAEAYNNLGGALTDQGQFAEAASHYQQAVRLKPDYAGARQNLANVLRCLGRYTEAAASYQEVLRLQPDYVEARYFHSILSGQSPDTAPSSYISNLFDTCAEDFDRVLVEQLHYRGPQLLRAAMADLPAQRSLAVLDLGCGTGLCGVQFRDLARTLVGVDLSLVMLAKARQRGVYDELQHGDLTEFLMSSRTQYDLILAADVLVYVGNLARVFQGVGRALTPSGRFTFTVEAHDGEGFVVRPSGRFAHSLAYLHGLAERNSFVERNVEKIMLRKQKEDYLDGYMVVLSRSLTTGH